MRNPGFFQAGARIDAVGRLPIRGRKMILFLAFAFALPFAVAAVDLPLNSPAILGNDNVWHIAASRKLTLGGAVSGNLPRVMQGGGTISLGASDLLPDGSVAIEGGKLALDNLTPLDNTSGITMADGPGGSISYVLDGAAPRFVRIRVDSTP